MNTTRDTGLRGGAIAGFPLPTFGPSTTNILRLDEISIKKKNYVRIEIKCKSIFKIKNYFISNQIIIITTCKSKIVHP